MKHYTVDTHALIWYFAELPFISRNAESCMMEADAGLAQIIVPTIVLSEVLMIGEKKRINFDYEEFLSNLVTSENYNIYPFDFDVLLQMRKLEAIPELHDRIIVATALITESILITKDREIVSSGIVQTIW